MLVRTMNRNEVLHLPLTLESDPLVTRASPNSVQYLVTERSVARSVRLCFADWFRSDFHGSSRPDRTDEPPQG